MQVKIKKLSQMAVIPKYAISGDAGLDLTATSKTESEGEVSYGTGLAVEIPKGFVGLIFPRSSIIKQKLILSNSVGVMDSNYRGEIMVKFRVIGDQTYSIGDRIAQMVIMPYPEVIFEEVDELGDTVRGIGGFGSTGK